jgi:hypothetical protein
MIKSYSLTITRSEILNLYMGTLNEITIHSISEWLKSKTFKQFIVIERDFVMEAVKYIEINKYSNGFLNQDIREKWNLDLIKEFVVGR